MANMYLDDHDFLNKLNESRSKLYGLVADEDFGEWESFRRYDPDSDKTLFGIQDSFGETIFEFPVDGNNARVILALEIIGTANPSMLSLLLTHISELENYISELENRI